MRVTDLKSSAILAGSDDAKGKKFREGQRTAKQKIAQSSIP
jgi:hypothetical protein